MDTKKKRNSKKPTLLSMLVPSYGVSVLSTRCGGCHPKGLNTFVNAGSPDIEYMYYALDVGSFTLKGSLLPASTR